MKPAKLFNRNFTMMIIGQIISLFGNAILRFALPLYVLDATGNAAIFGGILALSMIPTVLLSPIGGVIADRFPRQRIMYVLDFATAALVAAFLLVFGAGGGVAAVAVMMMLLSVIQACYQPSVMSAIPLLSSDENLMAANGVAMQVQAVSTLLGPILGGILYARVGVFPILAASAVCFFASAILELFIRIPYEKPGRTGGAVTQIRSDLGDALHFLRREKPQLWGFLFIMAAINLFLSALFIVGLPYLIKTFLGLSAELYSYAEAALGLGSILGGLLSVVMAKRMAFRQSYLLVGVTAILMLPIVLALALGLAPLATYGIIVVCVLVGMGCSALFSIFAQTYLQQQPPPPLLGKVSSFVSAICVCAMPLGQAMYGVLFEAAGSGVWMVVAFGMAVSLALTAVTGRALGRAVDAFGTETGAGAEA
ncbi:MFS transporter [Pseudoflavonifractor sp. BIOML-A16]|nr:MFS transporter [Pseudoflavonifractor sp. BIOML-A16]